MYVRMATWPITSRDTAGTPVPCLFTVACPWLSPGLERWATSHTHHVISQPRPSPFLNLRCYSLPRKLKRASNGEGLGPRLQWRYVWHVQYQHPDCGAGVNIYVIVRKAGRYASSRDKQGQTDFMYTEIACRGAVYTPCTGSRSQCSE